VTSPDDVRARFTRRFPAGLVADLAGLRPRPGSMVRYHTLLSLRELGRRAQFLDAQLERPGELIVPLVTARAPGLANRPVYLAIGIDCEGAKQVLGLWVGPTTGESAKFWLTVLSELKSRGVADVCIVCCDGLTCLMPFRWPGRRPPSSCVWCT
jgi:hypothetical protein